MTNIIDGITAPSSGAKPPALMWNTKSGGLARITGLSFDGGSTGGIDQADHSGIVAIEGSSSQFRLDHVTSPDLNRTAGVQVSGDVTGVIDHVTFNIGTHYGLYVFHDTWLGVGGYGDNSWAQQNVWGSAAFLFVEDCAFVAGSGTGINWGSDGWMGQRVVYRRNTYTNVLWANHGTATSGRARSARASEVYQNTFILNNAGWNAQLCCLDSVIGTRGGTSLIWDNTLSGTNGGGATQVVDMANLRSSDPRTFYIFNHCDGTNPWDQNAGPEIGYRCIDQPGAGQGDLLVGDTPTPFWPHEQLEPIYVWNNLDNGVLSSAVDNGVIPVDANRDVYNQVPGFTGTGGIGRELLAAMPTTCVPGVTYWATDEGEWDSTNGSVPDGRLYNVHGPELLDRLVYAVHVSASARDGHEFDAADDRDESERLRPQPACRGDIYQRLGKCQRLDWVVCRWRRQ